MIILGGRPPKPPDSTTRSALRAFAPCPHLRLFAPLVAVPSACCSLGSLFPRLGLSFGSLVSQLGCLPVGVSAGWGSLSRVIAVGMSALAVDVGGTKIAAGVVDDHGAVLTHVTCPTPIHDLEHAYDAVVEAAGEALDGRVVNGIGVACAGPVNSADGTVSPINVPCWDEFPLARRLHETFQVPVQLAGDGVCMALGEHWMGAGRGAEFLVGLVVSTGVGGGLVLHGRAYGGRTGNAGHIGHIVVEPDGLPCSCGARGCVETVAGGPHLVRWARRQGWRAPDNADAAHLAAAALADDEVARAAFDRAGRAVGLAIAATAALCDLDLAVVGGGIAQAGELLFDPIRQTLDEYARLSYVQSLRVVPAELSNQAGLVGAAALVLGS
jgi:glucokinase